MSELPEPNSDSGIELGELQTRSLASALRRNWQYSLWTLIVWLTLAALVGAAWRLEWPTILFIAFAAIAVCGVGAFGFVAYWLLNAIFTRSPTKLRRLVLLALHSLIGVSLIGWAATIGGWSTEYWRRRDIHAIDRRHIQLREALLTGDHASAHSIMTRSYRAKHSLATFQEEFHADSVSPLLPRRRIEFHGRRATVHYRGSIDGGSFSSEWEEIGDTWYFVDRYEGMEAPSERSA
jgi:hypothetical protein